MKRKLILIFLLVIFLGTASFSGYKVVTILAEYREGEKAYDEIQQYMQIPETVPVIREDPTVPPETTAPQETIPEETEAPTEPIIFPVVDFESLSQINEEVVGWIYIEDTHVNHPVVQTENNKKYLNTLFDGTRNKAGSAFMDYRNQPDISDRNTILYGHNMNNKTMFADLLKYRDQSYYEEHPMGLYIMPDCNYYFEIVAAYDANVRADAWQRNFQSDEDALQWIQDAMARSEFTCDVVPELEDKFITLSTCSYEFSNARFVLVGILKEY